MKVKILYNEKISPGCFRMGCEFDVRGVVPGQFVMLRVSDGLDPLLRRPFGVYRVIDGIASPGGVVSGSGIEIVYQVVGRGTRIMSNTRPGESLDILGPVGNGFSEPDEGTRVVLVAGGIGVVPLHMFATGFPGATLLFGVRSSADAAMAGDFIEGGGTVRIATEDGSAGARGLVTDLLGPELTEGTVVYACGPPGMLKAVAGMCAEAGVRCLVSLERAMACGIGVCLGCAVKTVEDSSPDNRKYKMVCSDGPVFDAAEIDWDKF